jgi:hypothetical protein
MKAKHDYCKSILMTLFVLSSIVITSCATTEGYKKIVQSWVGSDINRLIASWGPPTSTYNMPNGDVVYTWFRQSNESVNTGYNQYTRQIQTNRTSLHCETSFTTDRNGRIYTWSFKGNNCVAEE